MKLKNLGATGLKVRELAMGGFFTSAFGGDFEQSKGAIRRALELGVNYFDTAPNYGDSEEVMGKCLKQLKTPGDLVLSTKLGGGVRPFHPRDKDCLLYSIERSLKRLDREYIDLLLIHEADRPGQYDWWSDSKTFDGPVMELLTELKEQGVIHHIGLAGTTVYEMNRIVKSKKFDVLLTAFNFNLLFREAETWLIPEAAEQGMGIVVGSPLQMGALAKRYDQEIEYGAEWMSPLRRAQFKALYQLSEEAALPLAEMGLRFLLNAPGVSAVLTGARSAQEVETNVAIAEKGPLDAEVVKRLDEIARMLPCRPFEEPFALPFGEAYRGPGIVNSSKI